MRANQATIVLAVISWIAAVASLAANDRQWFDGEEVGYGFDAPLETGGEYAASRWTISADALILDRVMNPTNPIGFVDGNVRVTGRDFDFLPAAGPRVSGIYQRNATVAGEINYLGVHGFNASVSQTGSLYFFGPPNIFVGQTQGGWEYRSRLDSLELNLRWTTSPRWTWIGGFRYVELAESLHGEMSPPFDVHDFTARVNNQLYGGQLGADVTAWDKGGAVDMHLIAKAGAFSNRCFTRDDYFTLSSGERGTHTSFVGEIAAVGRFALSETWSLRGGYQLLWLSNVGVATDQLFNPALPGGPDMSGGLLMHGAIVGIEAQW